jgi:hypothetical protein
MADACMGPGLDVSSSAPRPSRRTHSQAFPESSVDIAPPPATSSSYISESSRGRDVQSQVDGLATVGVDNDDEALYGDSSTIAFVRQVASGGMSQPPSAIRNTQ